MGAGYVDALVKSSKIMAATLFTEDLERSKEFYARVFGLPAHYEDADSAVFMFGDTMVNLLRVANAPELIAPAPVGGPQAGARMQFTIWADDVDAVCAELARRGVTLINGPMDRPWGIRTACFADPSGHIWEVAGNPPED
jgi:catechol 2,3-dioxygenase-like lactoylglutathione lyase family enzyme